jgi:beta-lactamase superfamily II metal-dependent hydrolase
MAPLAHAQQLEVHFIDVDQGEATLIIGPTGSSFLFDGGPNAEGYASVVPLLQSKGISHLNFVSVSHYHADHLGGLDEVWQSGIQCTSCLDRGNNNDPSTQSYNDYKSTYSSVRQTVTPGQVVSLGGGATLTCLVVEGDLIGGGSVNISSSAQWENSASIAWRLEYGDFDMFMGGDLTGGGNGTTDVESSVAPLCGDVDVLLVNHHGSRTSTNTTFANTLDPEFAVISCGHSNSYGFPKSDVINALNRVDHTIPVWCTSEGTGGPGFVNGAGDIILTTDGAIYEVTSQSGATFTAHCDEAPPAASTSGNLVVSEFMRDPTKVSDTDGEWLELAGARVGEPVSLYNVEVSGAGGDFFRLGSTILLEAGELAAIGSNGLPSTNGGYTPVIAWPSGSTALSNTADDIQLDQLAGPHLDSVSWSSGWPGASGKSAERMDLENAGSQGNFTDAISSYGNGDRGTPGQTNDSDITSWGGTGTPWIDVLTSPSVGGPIEMNWYMPGESGHSYQGWLTLATTPGITVGGTHIPANLDIAYDRTHNLPGWYGTVPGAEQVYTAATVPNNNSLFGMVLYAIVVTYDAPNQIRSQSTPLAMIVL